MRFRMIAADLDYTLLDEESKISERNKKAIQEAVSRGVMFIIATGRMFKTSVAYMNDLKIDCDWPLINYHGALIKTSRSNKTIYHCPLENSQAVELIEEAHRKDCHVSLFIGDNLYVREENEHTRYYRSLTNIDLQPVGDLAIFLKKRGVNPTKLSIISWDGRIDKIETELKEHYADELTILQSRPYFLEITDKKATKGQALRWLAGKMGIAADEIIAFGDGYNDLDMVSYAGLGVAVGNAKQAVKDAASLITSAHNEDGVAEVIENYVLNQDPVH